VIRTVYSQVTKPSSTQTARAKTLPDPRDHYKGPNTTQHMDSKTPNTDERQPRGYPKQYKATND
jgi:hypothetical protein